MAGLQEVFVSWLMQRLPYKGANEIEEMLLGKLPDIRNTRSGQDLIAIGIEQGIEKGIDQGKLVGQVQLLNHFAIQYQPSKHNCEACLSNSSKVA